MSTDDIDAMLDKKAQEREEDAGAAKWDPDPGDTITGFLVKSGWYDGGPYEPQMWLLLKTEYGQHRRVYCPKVLHDQVLDAAPAIGSGLAVRYEGKVPKVNNPKQHYRNYTFVLIPNKDGEVVTDRKYWHENGTYRRKTTSPHEQYEESVEDAGGYF